MRTALYDQHVALGAKMVDFAGWEMPLQYQGVIQEHLAVREKVGVFDVSHMARIEIRGEKAGEFLNYLSTNIISSKPYKATYTVWCDEQGMCIDDLIVYKVDDQHYFVVVNASNRQKDLDHLKKYASDLEIIPKFEDEILAIQGPLAKAALIKHFPQIEDLRPMQFMQHNSLYIAATGYTGSGGYEVYGPSLSTLFSSLIEEGVEPIGLAARDTLRLEMGFALYGHELTEKIRACDTVSAWTIKQKKDSFLGKEALLNPSHYQYGIILEDKRIARQGDKVQSMGVVTSGSYSPSLEKPIALIMVDQQLKPGDQVSVTIRDRENIGHVVSLPFYKERSREEV